MFITLRGYHEYIGGCSVHRRDTVSTLGGGDIMGTSGGYHDACGGIPSVHRGDIMSTSGDVQYIGVFNRN